MNANIRTCTEHDIQVLAIVIRQSFLTVSERFGLTQENAPRHPSNCTADWVQKNMDRGVIYFVIESGNSVMGCVALELANPEVFYLERLAVLPCHREHGFGKALVNHVLSRAAALGAHRVDIGIIAQDVELKDWYGRIGFVESDTKEFPHLPFQVAFMSRSTEKGCQQGAGANR